MHKEAISLLRQLISIPSFSREENKAADYIEEYLQKKGIKTFRKENNIWAYSKDYSESKPTILLNSHIDTVRPTNGWDADPHSPTETDGKLIGLGSNDAGAPLVSLLGTFLHFNSYNKLNYNLIFSATSEEEVSGKNGMELFVKEIGKIDLAIVGEPTSMQMAIAEKGLMVLDCNAKGTSGHTAYNNGDNAIYNAIKDIEWFRNYSFDNNSELLGELKMTVTQINAGTQHNVIPGNCTFVVDVRTNEKYTNEEVFEIIKSNVSCDVKARSYRLNASGINMDNEIIKAANSIGINCFGSSTLSDQALMPFPSVKIGPGDSKRSHTANEFIYIDEIKEGIDTYIELIKSLNNI